MVTLEELDESTWQDFLNAPISVLMLSKNDCPSCLQLSKELTDWESIEAVHVRGVSKGKGFQGVMKRHNASGGPETHGSKFHRQVGSMGNRKPRRTMKNHPHAGQMGGDQVTLRDRKVIDIVHVDGKSYVAVRGSIPGAHNALVSLIFA